MSARDSEYWSWRLERLRLWLDILKHPLWAAVVIYGVTVLAGAIATGSPSVGEAVTVQTAPVSTPQQAQAAVEKFDQQAVRRGLGPNVTIDVGQVLELLAPLVRSGEVAPEVVEEVTRNVIQGGREITVDAARQLLERALRSETTVTTNPSGDTVIQTCAPILTVEAPERAVAPPDPVNPPRPSPCPIEK